VSGDQGGGISNEGPLSVVNCTISGNVSAIGGGIYSVHSPLTIVDSTISGNTATDSGKGGGLNFQVYGEGGEPPPVIEGTIISGNTGGDFYGSTYALGDDDFTGTNNVISGSALLTALGNFGGPLAGAPSCATSTGTAAADQEVLQTMALLPGSPALGAGASFDGVGGNPVTADERNVSRTADGGLYDIGAYESEGFDVTITGGSGQSAAINTAFSSSLAVHVTANDSDLTNLSGGVVTFIAPSTSATAVLGTNQLIESVVLGSGGTASVSATADDTAGSYQVTASASPTGTSSSNTFDLTNTGTTPSVPTLSISGPTTATGGLEYTLTLNTSDATQNIPLTWYINWGDGSALQTVTGENNDNLTPVTHIFATSPGNFTITAIATDGTNIYAAGEEQVNEDNEGTAPPGSVQAEVISTDLVNLTWNPVSGAEYYEVFRGPTQNFSPSYNTLIVDDLDSNSYQDEGVSAGNTYYYVVAAYNGGSALAVVGRSAVAVPDEVDTTEQLLAPASVEAAGVNDLEIFVSWADVQTEMSGFEISIGTSPSQLYIAGEVGPTQHNFIIRGYGQDAAQFLQEGVTYYVDVAAILTNSQGYITGTGDASASVEASVRPPSPFIAGGDDVIVICGGARQPMSYLLDGIRVDTSDSGLVLTGQSNQNSVGEIWADLVNEGYNVYISSDPWDGGDTTWTETDYGTLQTGGTIGPVLNSDGSGRLYDEIQYELHQGFMNVGLIGYSHGGGMIAKISTDLWYDTNTPQWATVVFAGTIDAVWYGTGFMGGLGSSMNPNEGMDPLAWSPALSDGVNPIWGGVAFNYYETSGYLGITGYVGLVRGTSMPGAFNLQVAGNHSTIGVDQAVLSAIETDINYVFGQLSY
jgi:hypothetical protein